MSARRWRPGGGATLAVAAAGVALWIAAGYGAAVLRAGEEEADIAPGRRAKAEAAAAALGGFRGLVADFLWLRAIQMQEEGRFDQVTLLYNLVLDLQPRFTSVWAYHAWNFAYNLAWESNTPAERWHWIRTGMKLLENDGIERNPHSYILCWEVASMYFFRVSPSGFDHLHRYYQEELAPVPDWCRDSFKFVDEGLWSDAGVRYRLYRMKTAAGKVTLGGPLAKGGYPTRARRMYAVAVRPPGWAGGARRQGDWGAAPRIALASGAPLYTDSPDRIAAARMHDLYWAEPEPSVPQELERAVLFLLPDADSVRTDDAYLEIDSEKDGEVWVGWFPDETRNYVIAREWLDKALTKDDCDQLKVRRLRAWTFARAGEFEEAYEAFRDLHLDYAEGDSLIGDAMKNFLLERIYHARRAGDEKGVETWFRRLQADFPSWMMSPEDAVREAAGRGMGNLMLDN